MNDAGQVVFFGDVLDDTGTELLAPVLWVADPGQTPEPLITFGTTQAPGLPAGTVLGDTWSDPLLNNQHKIALGITLDGPGVNASNDRSLWVIDADTANAVLIAREGDSFDVDPNPDVSDTRTIVDLQYLPGSRGEDGQARSFNHATELAYLAKFADFSSAIIVASISDNDCPADLSGDGNLNTTDINLFVNAFLASDPAADFNDDGNFNNTDINAFVAAFLAGCD